MTTIDHAAEARRKLSEATRAVSKSTITLTLADAQVHATLALVEQQKLANLIAARALSGAPGVELRADGESLNTLRAHTDAVIRGALGLDPLDTHD